MSNKKSTFQIIYNVVKQIPKGKVSTYGRIAQRAGLHRGARTVGWALHVNPDPDNIPCHRVVNQKGETSKAFAFGGEDVQKKLLEHEGVSFDDNNRVILPKHLW